MTTSTYSWADAVTPINGMNYAEAALAYNLSGSRGNRITSVTDPFCISPDCTHDRIPGNKHMLCKTHQRVLYNLNWKPADLFARELSRFGYRDCTLFNCRTPAKRGQTDKDRIENGVADHMRLANGKKPLQERRHYGTFHGTVGEYLCARCAKLVAEVPVTGTADDVRDFVDGLVFEEAARPGAAQRWPGLNILVGRRTVNDLMPLDSLPEEWAWELVGYAFFWDAVGRLRAATPGVAPIPDVLRPIVNDAGRHTLAAIERGELPPHAAPFRPHAIVLDSMYGFQRVFTPDETRLLAPEWKDTRA